MSNTTFLSKILYTFFFLSLLALLEGCVNRGVPITASGVSGPEGIPSDQLSFANFKDFPVPDGAQMDVDKTLIFGSESNWFGRLTFEVLRDHAATYDYFKVEMPNFGWEEVTSVRSEMSILTYTRENRVATIQLSSNNMGGSRASVTVSPKGVK